MINLDLTNKNAFVGGASRGIGRAIAVQLAAQGANITIAARSEKDLEHVLALLDTSKGQQHAYAVMDYSKLESVERIIKKITSTHPVHILINNTGGPKAGLIHQAETDEFLKAFNNHLICNQIFTKAVLAGMKEAAYGRIINIISTSVKQPIDGLGVSNTIRGAVANWAKTMANELGQFGITVNNVLPGFTETERLQSIIENRATQFEVTPETMAEKMRQITPAKRFAKPEETAYAVGFLASPAAAYINGVNLPVDGGRTKSL